MSILKKIGNVFYEKEDIPQKKQTSAKPIVESLGVNITAEISPVNDPNLLDNYNKHFRNIMETENKNNLPGNDYFEFQIMKNAMSGIADESIKYKAAYAGWSSGGAITKEFLLSTADKYLSIIDKEVSEFEEAYKIKFDNSVGKNERDIASKTEELQRLAEKINTLNSDIQSLKKENIDKNAELNSTRNAFLSAANMQKEEIKTEINKINQFIPNGGL